jgi:sugar phosphate isomerase/epimerase
MAELCFNTFNLSAWHGVEPRLIEQIDAAADAGFRLFGPDMFSLDAFVAGGGRLESLAEHLAARGMRCWEIAALDIGDEAATLAHAAHMAELAEVLRPEWILTNVSVPIDAAACATFEKICVILAAVGARPAVEYLPFTPADRIAAARTLVDHVGTDRARILFDTWHHFRGPDDWPELESAPLDLVAYVQFDDALPATSDDLVVETLARRTFPGEGEFDLDGYCERLRAKGFDGVVSVEILNAEWRADADLHEFARRAYESSARFWPSGG